jgi:hypothetical protein
LLFVHVAKLVEFRLLRALGRPLPAALFTALAVTGVIWHGTSV